MSVIQSQKLITGLQSQFNTERFNAEVYYSLAVQLDARNLTGFKSFMLKSSADERVHALKFSDYLADREVTPVLQVINAPTPTIGTDVMRAGALAFEAALALERTTTARIDALYNLAETEDDPGTCEYLLWFIKEQIDSERQLEEILTKFGLAEENGAAILMLNTELGGD